MQGTRGVALAAVMAVAIPALAQPIAGAVQLDVDRLGDFDYAVRIAASRSLRRAQPDVAVPILREAIHHHEDSYVQFRAAVLFFGFNPSDAAEVFEAALDAPNDRVRTAAYDYFAYAPSPRVVTRLLDALETETSEFVRPALVRALAAHSDVPIVRERLVRDIHRGQEFFRGAVIEALGDYRVVQAIEPLMEIASTEGPLQDDALLALGKIGDRRALVVLRQIQSVASEQQLAAVSAAACMLEVDCDAQLEYLEQLLRYAAHRDDEQERLRSAAIGLGALAQHGNRRALDLLFEVGAAASDAARAPIALAAGAVALRQPEFVIDALTGAASTLAQPTRLLRDAFDMLDEDLAEERFYVLMRRTYWNAPDNSPVRRAAGEAVDVLEF